MTIQDVRSIWMNRAVRQTTETLDHQPSHKVERIYESTTLETDTQYVAWTGEHIIENTPDLLNRRLAALAQPVRTHGRLSFGRYEVATS